VGGSVFGAQEIIQNKWITREKYQEEGLRCIPKGIF
jgi:actin-related protein